VYYNSGYVINGLFYLHRKPKSKTPYSCSYIYETVTNFENYFIAEVDPGMSGLGGIPPPIDQK